MLGAGVQSGDAARDRPVSEAFAVLGEAVRVREQLLPEGALETLFDRLPDAVVSVEEGAAERVTDWLETIADAFETRRLMHGRQEKRCRRRGDCI